MMSYAPKEDITKADIPAIKFPQTELPQEDRPDFRRPLNPNLNAVKKVAPKIKVAPEHVTTESELVKTYIETKNGPATYTPSHVLTEARSDVGIQKFRDNYHESIPEEDTQSLLNPNYFVDKPNKLVFKYF